MKKSSLYQGMYILKGRNVTPFSNFVEWCIWYKQSCDPSLRSIANSDLGDLGSVQTSFLGVSHGFDDDGNPLLFETIVIGGPMDSEMARTSSWDLAEIQHEFIVDRLKKKQH